MIRTDACAPRKIEKPCEINKNTGDGQIVSLKKKKQKLLWYPVRGWLSCLLPQKHFYIGLRSSILFLVKQALLCSEAAILSHLRFYLKGVFWGKILLFITLRRRSIPRRIWDILPTFLCLAFSSSISYMLFLFGELFCHDCWYLYKGTITKYISLCLF